MTLTFGSLFSGIGGFDLGLERAGLQCQWQVEIDEQCNNVLERHWPAVPQYGDVRECGRHNLTAVDLICGGFPCQDLSVAGKRAGLAGERSGLWFEFHRVVTELGPRWVVIENVPGLLSSNGGRDFAIILRGLVKCGYGVAWRVLDAQYFGVAQRRRRVFIVGHLGNGRAAEVLFEPEGGAWNSAPGREAGEGTAAATLRGFGHGWQGQHNDTNAVVISVSFALNAAASPRYDGESETLVTRNWQTGGDMRYGFNERPMLHSSQIPAVGVRRLTPVECERLQGFPDGWTGGQSDSTRYRQLGNAVCVPVAEWLGWRLAAFA